MDTKKLIVKKLNKVIYDDNVPINKDIPPIRYLIKYPFKEAWFNKFYWFLCTFLEPNTNKLSIKDVSGKYVPVTGSTLAAYGRFNKTTFRVYMSLVTYNGIVMSVRIGGFQSYYMNPAFVTCGKTYPSGLLEMFKTQADKIFGEHLFYKEGTMYRINRGEVKRET